VALEGPKAAAVVKELTGLALQSMNDLAVADVEILRFAQDDNIKKTAEKNSIPCRVVRRSPGKIPGAEFVVERDKVAQLWKILLEAARKHGGGPMGYAALSALRLAQGVPWFGYDFGEKQIPHEAGLENSHISYTKGCYTGQEIVERVRSRGQVNRQRVELVFSGDAVPQAGTTLTLDSKEVGYVTRAARIPEPSSVIGMGYVRKEGSAVGSVLHWSGGTATVSRFPI
jgi:folate-binding protein YgfZ